VKLQLNCSEIVRNWRKQNVAIKTEILPNATILNKQMIRSPYMPGTDH